jgi:hypothetical protein
MRRLIVSAMVVFVVLFATDTQAQSPVPCRSGLYCPPGLRCLADGLCGRNVYIGPCFPGYKSTSAGGCMPAGYTDCGGGRHCRPGTECRPGRCWDPSGRLPLGSNCPRAGGPCMAGEVCGRSGCYDPRLWRFCGASKCGVQATCGESNECLNVPGERVRQAPRTAFEQGPRTQEPSSPRSRPDRPPQGPCNPDLVQRYLNEKEQCENRRDMSNDVCKEQLKSAPERSAGCYLQTKTVYAICIDRLTTVYPAGIEQCSPP